MSYSQKYTLVYFISPLQVGAEFHMTDWPLHITLADVFAIDRSATNIDEKMTALISNIQSIEVGVIGDSMLDVTPVVLLEKTTPLTQLHNEIVSLLEENGAVFNNPEFTKDGFLPHSTIQKTGRLQIGEKISINTISLIDMFPTSDWKKRKVIATFSLK